MQRPVAGLPPSPGKPRIDPERRRVGVDLPAGNVTVGNSYSVLPSKNTLLQLKMTGAEVKAALEDAMTAVVASNTGSYPYTGGLRWNVDHA